MNHDAIRDAVEHLLLAVGEEPEREGLLGTPGRVARMYEELLEGYALDTSSITSAVFSAEGYDQLVLLRSIEFDSLCEHHLLPFRGKAAVAYLPDKKVIGISKLARIVDLFARRLQVQERMTEQIATFIMEHLQPLGVGVIVEAQHQCMGIRGVRKRHSVMTTSALHGAFRDDAKVRAEFLQLCEGAR